MSGTNDDDPMTNSGTSGGYARPAPLTPDQQARFDAWWAQADQDYLDSNSSVDDEGENELRAQNPYLNGEISRDEHLAPEVQDAIDQAYRRMHAQATPDDDDD